MSVRYGGGESEVVALDDISFAVAEGEFAVIVGPSGCGKSTLLRLIAGLQGNGRSAKPCWTERPFPAPRASAEWFFKATRCFPG